MGHMTWHCIPAIFALWFFSWGKQVWPSPDVMTNMGAKDALCKIATLGIGLIDTFAYYSPEVWNLTWKSVGPKKTSVKQLPEKMGESKTKQKQNKNKTKTWLTLHFWWPATRILQQASRRPWPSSRVSSSKTAALQVKVSGLSNWRAETIASRPELVDDLCWPWKCLVAYCWAYYPLAEKTGFWAAPFPRSERFQTASSNQSQWWMSTLPKNDSPLWAWRVMKASDRKTLQAKTLGTAPAQMMRYWRWWRRGIMESHPQGFPVTDNLNHRNSKMWNKNELVFGTDGTSRDF